MSIFRRSSAALLAVVLAVSAANAQTVLPLSTTQGGTGTTAPALVAGSNITITGTWPNNTISASGGGGSGTVNSGTSGQVAYYGSTGTAVSGEALTALLDSSIGSTQGDILYRSSTAWSVLAPGTSGFFLQTQGASANPTWAAASGGSGCSTGGSAGNLLTANGSGGCTTDTSTSLTNGALSLGASGTAGSIALGNATSGTVTIQPVTGALGSAVVSVPAVTDTLVALAATQTLTNKSISGSSNTLSNVGLTSLATQSANTVVGNATGSSANPTALSVPSCSGASNALTWTSASGFGCNTISGSGTVTSVGQTFTGGLISVGGSPVTTSGTLALTVAGTSGGIPYFSSSSTWASSGALTSGQVVLGGGAGSAPTTTAFATASNVDAGTSTTNPVTPSALTGSAAQQTVTESSNAATVTWTSGYNARITLNGNLTSLTLSSPSDGICYTLRVVQPSSGGPYTVTWPSSVDWGAAGTPTLSTTASATDLVTACYDGSASKYDATIATGF